MRGDAIRLLTCGDKTTMDAEVSQGTGLSALENRCGVDASPWGSNPTPSTTPSADLGKRETVSCAERLEDPSRPFTLKARLGIRRIRRAAWWSPRCQRADLD
jgi:hypothetical protein